MNDKIKTPPSQFGDIGYYEYDPEEWDDLTDLQKNIRDGETGLKTLENTRKIC